MSNGILHIYSFDRLEEARDHSIVAGELGFDVHRVGNDVTLHPEDEAGVLAKATSDDFVAVWADVEAKELSERSKRIVLAAGEAGKTVVGHLRSQELDHVRGSLITLIGLPKREEDA